MLALAGCSSDYYLRTPDARAVATPGTHSVGGSLDVRGGSNSIAAALIGLGLVSWAIYGNEGRRADPVPELDPQRRIVEHDCTQPLGEIRGNLVCR